jgi:hypothetical protein
MTNCRIGNVRIKTTGQNIKIIPKVERTEVAQKLVDNLFRVLNNHPNPHSYMLIVLDEDGAYSTRVHSGDCTFGNIGFISLVKSLLDRDTLTNYEIRWFCKQQGWIDD